MSMALTRGANMFAAGRQALKTAVRECHGPTAGVYGYNLPFNPNNRWLLTVKMIVFFGSGLAVPFYGVKHQIDKKRGA